MGVEGGEAVLSVRDQGVGLRPEDIDQLFKKYGRVAQAQSVGPEGIGLGLYLTRLLVTALGGSISATSPGAGQGSRFAIRLPLAT